MMSTFAGGRSGQIFPIGSGEGSVPNFHPQICEITDLAISDRDYGRITTAVTRSKVPCTYLPLSPSLSLSASTLAIVHSEWRASFVLTDRLCLTSASRSQQPPLRPMVWRISRGRGRGCAYSHFTPLGPASRGNLASAVIRGIIGTNQ